MRDRYEFWAHHPIRNIIVASDGRSRCGCRGLKSPRAVKTQIFLAMSAQYDELLKNSSAAFWLSVPVGTELPERTDDLTISMLRFCTLVSLTYLLFCERRIPKRMWELMFRSADRRFRSPLFVREWEHLRSEFESFPEFVALVASVHHMPPHTKSIGPGPVLPAHREGHQSPC